MPESPFVSAAGGSRFCEIDMPCRPRVKSSRVAFGLELAAASEAACFVKVSMALSGMEGL